MSTKCSSVQQAPLPCLSALSLTVGLPDHQADAGFLLGTRQTLLETTDGGKSWNPRRIEAAQDEGFNYRSVWSSVTTWNSLLARQAGSQLLKSANPVRTMS